MYNLGKETGGGGGQGGLKNSSAPYKFVTFTMKRIEPIRLVILINMTNEEGTPQWVPKRRQ
jgi:hypothetical protein